MVLLEQFYFHPVYTVYDSSLCFALHWRHNERNGVSNHQRLDCLLNRLFRRRSRKTPKLRVTGLYAGNSPVTGEFPAQRVSDAENVSIWWRHHGARGIYYIFYYCICRTYTVNENLVVLSTTDYGHLAAASTELSHMPYNTGTREILIFSQFQYLCHNHNVTIHCGTKGPFRKRSRAVKSV